MTPPPEAARTLLRRAGTCPPTLGDASGSDWTAYHLPARYTTVTGRAGHIVVRHPGVPTAEWLGDAPGDDDPGLTGHGHPGPPSGGGS